MRGQEDHELSADRSTLWIRKKKKKQNNQQQPKYKQNTKGKRLLRGKEMGKKIKAQNTTCAIISNNF